MCCISWSEICFRSTFDDYISYREYIPEGTSWDDVDDE